MVLDVLRQHQAVEGRDRHGERRDAVGPGAASLAVVVGLSRRGGRRDARASDERDDGGDGGGPDPVDAVGVHGVLL